MAFQSKHFAKIGNMKMFYRKMGSGRPLILLHGGWATGELNWASHYDALAKKFEIYSPDNRGHGRSDNPTGKFNHYGELAWETIAFIEQLRLDKKPIVVGHSDGAIISLLMSIYQPEKLAAQVLIGLQQEIGNSKYFQRGMETFFNTKNYQSPPSIWTYMLHHPLRALALRRGHGSKWFNLLLQVWPMWIKPLDLMPRDYEKIKIPTLIINGSEDEFVSPEESRTQKSSIPGAKLKIADGQNHMIVIDQPELLREYMLPFLRKMS